MHEWLVAAFGETIVNGQDMQDYDRLEDMGETNLPLEACLMPTLGGTSRVFRDVVSPPSPRMNSYEDLYEGLQTTSTRESIRLPDEVLRVVNRHDYHKDTKSRLPSVKDRKSPKLKALEWIPHSTQDDMELPVAVEYKRVIRMTQKAIMILTKEHGCRWVAKTLMSDHGPRTIVVPNWLVREWAMTEPVATFG